MQPSKRAQRRFAHGDRRAVRRHEPHVGVAARVEIVADFGGHEDGVVVEAVQRDQVVEERPREVLDAARDPGAHPAQIDDRAQRRIVPRRRAERRADRVGIAIGQRRGVVRGRDQRPALHANAVPKLGVAQRLDHAVGQCLSAVGEQDVHPVLARNALRADPRGDDALLHGPRLQDLVPHPGAEAQRHDHHRRLRDVGTHVRDEAGHHHTRQHREEGDRRVTSRPTIQNSASGTVAWTSGSTSRAKNAAASAFGGCPIIPVKMIRAGRSRIPGMGAKYEPSTGIGTVTSRRGR